MDCYTCNLYRQSSATKSFIPHINSSKPLRQKDPSTQILNLHIESQDIPSDNINSQDFLCVMSIFGRKGWRKYARTEVSFSHFSRKWIQPITIRTDLKLFRFDVYQIVSDLYSLRHQQFIGDCEVELEELLKEGAHRIPIRLSFDFLKHSFESNAPSSPQSSSRPLSSQEIKPYLIIKHRELQMNAKGSLFFKMSYSRYNPVSMFFKPSAYFEIEISENDILVYRSNTVKIGSNRSIIFDTVEFNQQLLSGCSHMTPLRFTIHEIQKKDSVMFSFETTIDALTALSVSKYPIDDINGNSIGEFGINFIGSTENMRIDDLKLNGVSFLSIFAIDFSCGKKACDSFRMALTEVGDSLNCIAQVRPFIGFGFGSVSDKQNIFTFNKTAHFSSIKNIMNCYRERLLKCEKLPQKANLMPAIIRAKKFAIEKWREKQIYSIVTIITDGNVEDFQDSIDAIIDCQNLPMIFLLVTVNSLKNRFVSLYHKEKNVIHSKGGGGSVRKMFKVFFYGNTLLNQPQNLKGIRGAAVKMIQQWSDAVKDHRNFSDINNYIKSSSVLSELSSTTESPDLSSPRNDSGDSDHKDPNELSNELSNEPEEKTAADEEDNVNVEIIYKCDDFDEECKVPEAKNETNEDECIKEENETVENKKEEEVSNN